ncbi:MAG: chorismate synthase [Chlamydiia bacterium]|nr:chorismate synthase [Chlamydiia bacterium]
MGNQFGHIFRITTWGESHGPAIGVVIDGCPAGLELDVADVQKALDERRPGTSDKVSPRNESDQAQILSGVFEGQTTGAPISIIIWNRDANSEPYEAIKDLLRPGHANYTYLQKYGRFDYRGGGRASARETACRVAAGAIAHKLLLMHGIDVQVTVTKKNHEPKDSVGGIVTLEATGLPAGLGAPIFDKLEADLAKAMLSIPATKGFEIGHGFAAADMKGSEHNDGFDPFGPSSNHAGGTLGGISTGMPLICRIAFKPTSSIQKTQKTTTINGDPTEFKLSEEHRHDPCVAIRGAFVCKAMLKLVLADHLIMNHTLIKIPQ